MAAKRIENLPTLSADLQQLVAEKLRNSVVDNRIACAAALAVARELGLPSREVGAVANAEGLRICKCQLGCF